MADYNVPVTVFVKDLATAAFTKIGKGAVRAQKIVSTFGRVGAAAMKGFAIATTGINQGLELFRKGLDTFRMFTDKSREYRGENDQLIKSFDQSNELIGSLAARIGDALINAFNAAVTALGPLIESARDFFVANQKIIGLRLIEFFRDVALVVATGVSKAVIGASRIVTFFALTWEALKTGVNTAVAAILNGLSSVLDTAADAAAYIPGVGDDIALKFRSAANSAKALGDEFVSSGDAAKKEIETLLDQQAQLEQTINNVEQAVKTGIGKTATAAMQGLAEATAGANNKLDENVEKSKETKKQSTELADALKAQQAEAVAFAQSLGGLSATIGESFGQTFTALVTGAEKSGEVFTAFIGNALTSTVQFARDSIISAQLAAMSNAAIGASFGGPLAIIGATAVVAGIFEAFLAKLPGMADGGMVRGGTRGRDSVPILAMPGEYVMNTDQVDAMRQMFSNMDGVNTSGRFANGGTVGSSPAGGINITIKSEALPNKAEVAKYVRSTIVPAMNDLKAQGAI